MQPDDPRHVFVYGTLRRGEVNDITRLHPAPRFLGFASITGTLYDLGRYPGLRLEGVGRVVGEVYAITSELEKQLDRIEDVTPHADSEYARRHIDVALSGGVWCSCLLYEVGLHRVQGLAPMPGGDWVCYRQQRP